MPSSKDYYYAESGGVPLLKQENDEKEESVLFKLRTYLPFSVLLAFLSAATGGMLFGYIIGITSNAVVEQSPGAQGGVVCSKNATHGNDTDCYDFTEFEKSLLTSMNIIFALIGTLICFRVARTLGRRRELMLGAVLYLSGGIVSGLAVGAWMVWLGQALYGLGVGFSMHAAPAYVAEVAPACLRGLLVALKEAFIVLGILLGFLVGNIFHDTHGGWRYMLAAVPTVFSVLQLVGIYFSSPSPRWLLVSGDVDRARNSLQNFRVAKHDSDEELFQMQTAVEAESDTSITTRDLFRGKYGRALFIGCGVVVLQQLTGQPSVLYYATTVFKYAGFGSSASLQPVYVGGAKLIFTLIAAFTVDRAGRKPLLYVGISVMLISLVLLAVAFSQRYCSIAGISLEQCRTEDIALPEKWGVSAVVALMLYVSGYQLSFGPIAWLLISELFPINARGKALSIAASANFSTNIVVTIAFTPLLTALTPTGAFALYAALCVVSILFVKAFVFETKGLTLEEIEERL